MRMPLRGLARGLGAIIELFEQVAGQRVTGSVSADGIATFYFYDGDLYCAERAGGPALLDTLVGAGALDAGEAEDLGRRRQPWAGPRALRRVDVLDAPVPRAAVRRYVEDSLVLALRAGAFTYRLDPYDVHHFNVVDCGTTASLLAAARTGLACSPTASRAPLPTRVPLAPRAQPATPPRPRPERPAAPAARPARALADEPPSRAAAGAPAPASAGEVGPGAARRQALRRLIGALRRMP